MSFFGIRFDFRNPEIAGTTMTERYSAALDMCEWADRLGFVTVAISEHHGSPDGYLPSPAIMAAAIAARTKEIRIQIAALIAPFHDPLRIAEDLAVVDLLSAGRLDLIVANGYVPAEFEMFGTPVKERVKRTTETVGALKQAWAGEPFEHRGRIVQITPVPHQPGGPQVSLGGSTEPAARRAARIADGFMPSTPEVWTSYRDEMVKLGKPDPGEYPGGDTSVIHLALDVDQGWKELAPFAMHEVNAYGKWMEEGGTSATGGYKPVDDADTLRATGQYRVLTPDDLVTEIQAKGPFGFTMFHPLVGGMTPDLGWQSLRLFETDVLPQLGDGDEG